MIWQKVELGEVVTLQRGYDLTERERRVGNIPVVSSSGISGYHDEAKVKGPGVVTGRYGTLGQVYYITGNFWPHNTTLFVKDFHGNDVRFAYYLLSNLNLGSQSAVSAVPGVNRNTLHRLPVMLPPLPIQQRIAEILGRLDDKIEVNRRINRTLEAMAQALYKHWFVDFGPFQDGEFVESELGLLPQGWTTTMLKEITTKIGSGATPLGGSSVYIDDGVYLIRSQNVYDSRFEWAGLARITDEAAAKLSNVMVAEGDVLINITGDSILRTCVTDRAMIPARVNQHVAIIRSAPGMPPHFIHQHLLLNMSSGATRKAVTKANLENTPILLPPTSILSAFRAKTDPFFGQISVNNRESRKLTEIRDYLLPKLLNGKILV